MYFTVLCNYKLKEQSFCDLYPLFIYSLPFMYICFNIIQIYVYIYNDRDSER